MAVSFTKSNGQPRTCKFCRQAVGLDLFSHRVMNLDGKTFHSDSCERRKAFYKNEAAIRNQYRRDARERPA